MPASSDPSAARSGELSTERLQQAATLFGMLSAMVRLHLVWLLAERDTDVGTLAESVGHSVPTVSHHLNKLKLAGLVSSRRAGKHQIYGLSDPDIEQIVRIALAVEDSDEGQARPRDRSA